MCQSSSLLKIGQVEDFPFWVKLQTESNSKKCAEMHYNSFVSESEHATGIVKC